MSILRALPLIILATPALSFAHGGIDGSVHHTAWQTLSTGFIHPFTGVDHWAAMLALGLWSAISSRRAWAAPGAFAAMLAAGFALGSAGLAPAGVEPGIAVSLLVLGLLLAARRGLPDWGGAAMAGAFALFHGAAHGQELSGGAVALAGMLAATLLLHGGGIALARWLPPQARWWPRLGGAALALFGALTLSPFA